VFFCAKILGECSCVKYKLHQTRNYAHGTTELQHEWFACSEKFQMFIVLLSGIKKLSIIFYQSIFILATINKLAGN